MAEVILIPERKISGFQFELVPFLRENEDCIDFKRLELRAREFEAITGEKEANFLFNHQDLIPESWRRFKLLFCGWSEFRSVSGEDWRENWREFAILGWKDNEWSLEWRIMSWICLGAISNDDPCLEDGGGQLGDRLVRCVKDKTN